MTKPFFSEKLTGLIVKKPSNYAAGKMAIKKSIEHLMNEMGPVRAFTAINKMNKKDGFDCPGCAWPDPDDKRSVLGEYCENGAKALAEEATMKKVGPDFFAQHTLSELRQWSDFEIGKSGRLTSPLTFNPDNDKYEAISWENAIDCIAKSLTSLNDPNEAVFYTSGRSSNEAAFLYSLLARRLGTNNLPDCSNMCHESSGVGLSETLGIGKGSVTLEDLHKAEVIMIIGQNPGTNHPRMLTSLQKAKKNGAKVITINPLIEAGLKKFKNPQKPEDLLGAGTDITDVYLQVKINQDVALLKAIQKSLISMDEYDDVLDHDFISNSTVGFEAMQKDLEQYQLEDLIVSSGVKMESFQSTIDILKGAKKLIICWAMGLTQHKNGVDNIKECVNLLLMKGAIGKEGSGTCPVRGHSNVQGDRTVGINHKITPGQMEIIKNKFAFNPPQAQGYDVVEAIMAMHENRARIFMSLGGNFICAASDTHYTAEAVSKCDLTVSISTKLNRSHLYPGKRGLILPTLGRSEKDISNGKVSLVTVENSMGKIQPSKGVLDPVSDELMSEPDIISRIGLACFGDHQSLNWSDYIGQYDRIRTDISDVIGGFEQYNQRIENGNEFYLPNNARVGDFSKLPGGRAHFSICPLPFHEMEQDDFLLMTIRSHDQFNTTIYGLDDRYRGIYGERRVVLMNQDDMDRMQIQNKELITLLSTYDNVERRVDKFYAVSYDIPSGNLAAYFPETNPLIPIDQYADKSQTPISKSIRVKVLKYTPSD